MFSPDFLQHPLVMSLVLVLVGTAAAVVNTIAGGGSFLVLPVLVAFGLPPSVANGTVRVGVVVQGVVSASTFRRRGLLTLGPVLRLAPGTMLGAWGGAELACVLDESRLRASFGLLLLGWAVVLVLRPGRFLEPPARPRPLGPGGHALAMLIGAYGGFIQAGVGFPLMALLVYGLGHEVVRANAIKVSLTLIFTLAALVVFLREGSVAWREAAALAAGNLVGGWLGTHWQIKAGARLVRVFVVVMVSLSGLALLVG